MRNRWLALMAVSCVLVGFASRNATAAFAGLFQVSDVKGQCSAQTPDGKETKDLKGGEGLAYGTVLRTAADGSVTVVLSPENRLVLGGDVIAVISQDPSNASLKVLRLHRGKVEATLAKDFEKENGLEVVTRCIAIRVHGGGSYSMEATREADLNVVVINCHVGELDLSGPYFDVPVLKDNDGITVACSKDRSFIRLRGLSGKFDVRIKDSSGNTRMASMVQDSVIKILRKTSDTDANVLIITVLEVGPDGNVIQADTYQQPAGQEPELLNTDVPGQAAEQATGGAVTPPTGLFPTTTSSTTTSTTTTTVPPADAAAAAAAAAPAPTTTTRPVTTTRPPPPTTTTRPVITHTGRF